MSDKRFPAVKWQVRWNWAETQTREERGDTPIRQRQEGHLPRNVHRNNAAPNETTITMANPKTATRVSDLDNVGRK